MPKSKALLLDKYYKIGWLKHKYIDGTNYSQPYNEDERLLAGKLFYNDYIRWKLSRRLTINYDQLYVDISRTQNLPTCSSESERFRKALKQIPKSFLPLLYKILLEEKEIKAPKTLSEREISYFNNELKGILCRCLDGLCDFYKKKYK
jgi:hypothetical protein